MITTIFFDLDGTLLPMNMEEFTGGYFKFLCKKVAPYGYEPEKLVQSVWKGTAAMVRNDGSCSNEDAFWKCFCAIYGENAINDKCLFDAFYREEFRNAKQFCGFNEKAAQTVAKAKEKGLKTVLATNPLFPQVATRARIEWAGLHEEDFECYTTYENSRYCKPNPKYYADLVAQLGLEPEECAMVGNDVSEDMVAESIGMKVFLLTDCLINKENKDVDAYPHGDFDALQRWIETL